MGAIGVIRILTLIAILVTIPASLLVGPTQAQSDIPLLAGFPDSEYTSLFHTGTSSTSQVAVSFTLPVEDFDLDTPSAVVSGGEVKSVEKVSVQTADGETKDQYVFALHATGDDPITFRLLPDIPCASGGICTQDGRPIAFRSGTRVIPGPATVTFEEASYQGGGGTPAEVVVITDTAAGREVSVPLTVTYGEGVNEDDLTGIPENLDFGSVETRTGFEVAPADGGFDGDQVIIRISLGELPPGIKAGDRTSIEVTVQDDEVWSTVLTVGSTEGYLGYSTFLGVEEGGLGSDEFSWRETPHTVTNLVVGALDGRDFRNVSLDVSPGLRSDIDRLYLVLGDLTLNLADGQINNRQFFWRGVELDWEEDDTVNVGLRQYPPVFQARSKDGRGNNAGHPDWGRTGTHLLRYATVSYMDRVSGAPTWLPNARLISNTALAQGDPVPNTAMASDILWQWGQFLDHDISLTPQGSPGESLDIAVPNGDPTFDPGGNGRSTIRFTRSEFDSGTGTGPDNVREQVNRITAFIDASQVYGSDGERARVLRTNDGSGKLRTSADGRFLMYNTAGLDNEGGKDRRDLFLAGDVRVNEQVGLTAMHTLFVREHNRLAEEIAEAHPGLSGNEIYEIARKIVGAQMQVITYNEFLPLLLGPAAIGPYEGYDPGVDPSIANEFSTGAFRVGHTMLPSALLTIDSEGNGVEVSLTEAFFNPSLLIDRSISDFIRGLIGQEAQEVDLLIVDEARNMLFRGRGGGVRGLDLAALNIQRGRDHGIAGYNTVRRAYGLPAVTSFSEVSSDSGVQKALEEIYDDVDDLELWTGGLAEDHFAGSMVGETFAAIIADQFRRLRDGDRFWFENDPYFHANPELLNVLRTTTLSDIIRRNTPISDEISDNAFVITEPQP